MFGRLGKLLEGIGGTSKEKSKLPKKVVVKQLERTLKLTKEEIKQENYKQELARALDNCFNPNIAKAVEIPGTGKKGIGVKTKSDLFSLMRKNGITVHINTDQAGVSDGCIITHKRDDSGQLIYGDNGFPLLDKCIYFVGLVNTDSVTWPENTYVFFYPFYEFTNFSIKTLEGKTLCEMRQDDNDFDGLKRSDFVVSENKELVEGLRGFTTIQAKKFIVSIQNPKTLEFEEHMLGLGTKQFTYTDSSQKQNVVTLPKMVLIDFSIASILLVADFINMNSVANQSDFIKFEKGGKKEMASLNTLLLQIYKTIDEKNARIDAGDDLVLESNPVVNEYILPYNILRNVDSKGFR